MRTWWDLHSPYRYRNENLERMGFRSYRAYLKSDLWKQIRARVLEWAPKCQRCNRKPATQIHHRAYDPATLKGEDLRSLSALCGRCHRIAEHPERPSRHSYERLTGANMSIYKRRKRLVYSTKNVAALPRLVRPE